MSNDMSGFAGIAGFALGGPVGAGIAQSVMGAIGSAGGAGGGDGGMGAQPLSQLMNSAFGIAAHGITNAISAPSGKSLA